MHISNKYARISLLILLDCVFSLYYWKVSYYRKIVIVISDIYIIVIALWPPSNNCYRCLFVRRVKPRLSIFCLFKKKKNDHHFLHRIIHCFLHSPSYLILSTSLAFISSKLCFTTMEESNNQNSPLDIFETRPSPMPEEVPFDLSSSANTIPLSQKPKETTVSWSSHCVNKKSPRDYARDGAEKYVNYFKEGEILPLPELVEAVEPKTLSFVVTDLKTKRLARLKKKTFEDLLKSANIPGKYFCRRSLATWDVLPPSEEVAKKLAVGNIATRFSRLQPEYRGKRRIKVTVCNVSMQLSGDFLAAYLSIYGGVEQVTQVISNIGTAYGDYVFIMCLDRGEFNNVPHLIKYRDQTMTVVVEGRKPLCWSCKKNGHFFQSLPSKNNDHHNNEYYHLLLLQRLHLPSQ